MKISTRQYIVQASCALAMIIFGSIEGYGQSFTDEKTFTVPAAGIKALHLHNMNGEVTVTGTSQSEIHVEVKRTLKSFSSEALEDAKENLFFDSLVTGNRAYFFQQSPYGTFKIDADGLGGYESCGYKDSRIEVDHEFEINVRMPASMDLYVSNHRQPLKVSNILGQVTARNHHDDLIAEGIGSTAMLKNHHGDILATLATVPNGASRFKTHHGDIRVYYPDALSASVYLKSRHGEFFTDFDWSPKALALEENRSASGTKYVVGGKTGIQIGDGKSSLDFSTWHGDVYILKSN